MKVTTFQDKKILNQSKKDFRIVQVKIDKIIHLYFHNKEQKYTYIIKEATPQHHNKAYLLFQKKKSERPLFLTKFSMNHLRKNMPQSIQLGMYLCT